MPTCEHKKTTTHLCLLPNILFGFFFRCSGRVINASSSSDTHRVTLVEYSVTSHEWGTDRIVFTTNGIYPWSFVTQIFGHCYPSHAGDRK